MVVLDVSFEMFRKLVDSTGEQSDLHFWRAGVSRVRLVLSDNLSFCFLD